MRRAEHSSKRGGGVLKGGVPRSAALLSDGRLAARRLGAIAALVLAMGGGVGARASSSETARSADASQPDLALTEEPATQVAPVHPARPRMAIAIGAGATFDSSGFAPGVTKAVPSFAAVGDIGEGPAGFGLGVYASSASGRYARTDTPVDRLGMAAMLVLRPFALRLPPETARYSARVARTVGVELGLGAERDGQSALAGSRLGVHTGVRLEFPLTPPSAPTALRIRFAARRLIGLFEPLVGSTAVQDTTDLTASLTLSF